MQDEKIVISLGGSLIVPDEIDVNFLQEFKSLIVSEIEKGKKFLIITGGGKTARKYQTASKDFPNTSNDDLDFLGIYTCRLNALLVKNIFGELAYPELIINMDDLTGSIDNPIIILGPNKPGRSSDFGAVQIAEKVDAKKVINLSNIDYAYDKDPNKYSDAKKLENISWAEYRKLIPKEWQPGLSAPFDPIASEKAESLGIEVAIMNGRNIENLKNYLDGEAFIGTTIK